MSVTNKDVASQNKLLGQYFTPTKVVEFCLSQERIHSQIIVEPSCGEGVWLDPIREHTNQGAQIIALELDQNVLGRYDGKEIIQNINFYDFNQQFTQAVHFVGNPPHRSPAYSLTTHKQYVKKLRSKYGVNGVREESVLFILKTFDLLKTTGGWFSYILPRAIFQNNSKVFTSFTNFLKVNTRLVSVYDLPPQFEGVQRDLVYATFEVGGYFLWNKQLRQSSEFYGVSKDIIPFQRIFKKTHLGSVPCESVFLSCSGESKKEFRDRLVRLWSKVSDLDEYSLRKLLSYKGKPHLLQLRKENFQKASVVVSYVRESFWLVGDDIENWDYYKPIRHRNEDRWYFRHEGLKRASFVYQLNSNPCPSFYFPGNPSRSSKDYFGFCDYDVNRNSGPGANRTVPIEGVEDNLTDEFKEYWTKNTHLPLSDIFRYILHISKSDWYKDFKIKNQRFYFGVPVEFDKSFQ